MRVAILSFSFACGSHAQQPANKEHAHGLDRRLAEAEELFEAGRRREAGEALESLIKDAAAVGAGFVQAQSYVTLAKIAIAAGDYDEAANRAEQGIRVARRIEAGETESAARNQLASARFYEGDYEGALKHWEICLELDRRNRDPESETIHLSNIGAVYDNQGRFSEALSSYQRARRLANTHKNAEWQQIVTANLATLLQRVGQHERALDLYRGLLHDGVKLQPARHATMLSNMGAVYRHLGDPVKALETYGAARALHEKQHDTRGELNVLNNIGLAEGFDLGLTEKALTTLSRVEEIARSSGDRRKAIRAQLHSAELHWRSGRTARARQGFRAVLGEARDLGTPDEQWRALHGLARVAEASNEPKAAVDHYLEAIAHIESVRSRLESPSLRTEFMSNKDDVYDGIIELTVRASEPKDMSEKDYDALLRLIQRQQGRLIYERLLRRMRTNGSDRTSDAVGQMNKLRSEMAKLWRQRLQADKSDRAEVDRRLQALERDFRETESMYYQARGRRAPTLVGLKGIQAALQEDTALLVSWIGREWYCVLWITSDRWGLIRAPQAEKLISLAQGLRRVLKEVATTNWKPLADELGSLLLGDVGSYLDQERRHVLVVADSGIHGIPFEALGIPEAHGQPADRLVERAAVSYLPSSAMVPHATRERRSWRSLFDTYALVLANPLGATVDSEAPEPIAAVALPFARKEVSAIARRLPGSVQIYEGAQARKQALLRGIADGPAVVHLATHAVADLSNSDYSRILLAPTRIQ